MSIIVIQNTIMVNFQLYINKMYYHCYICIALNKKKQTVKNDKIS